MKIGDFYIYRNPFRIEGVRFGKYKIIEETENFILLRISGSTYWNVFTQSYSSPNYTIIKKFIENNQECGTTLKYFDYSRQTKQEVLKEVESYWKEINKNKDN